MTETNSSLLDQSTRYDDFPISLVITDPRLPDNPLVYVNRAFTELTGYTSTSACGRNCRFLQGEDTDATAVRELADAIEAREPAALEIVNYTAAGERFLNHLVITPIQKNGETLFFMGVQAGWKENSEDREIDMGVLRQRLKTIDSRVQDHISVLLSVIREEIDDPEEPSEVISLLSSRVECLAQLYAGVFRRYSVAEARQTRLGAYLGRVCSGTHVSDRSYNVRLSTNFIDCMADIDTTAMIGLTLSELLANAFDDVNPYDAEAEIEVDLEWDDEGARLSVKASSRGDRGSLLPQEGTVGRRLLDTLLPRLGTELSEHNSEDARHVTVALPMLVRPDAATVAG